MSTAEQDRDLVLRWVENHGEITRAEVAKLCGLSSSTALHDLRKMTNGGLLERTWDPDRPNSNNSPGCSVWTLP